MRPLVCSRDVQTVAGPKTVKSANMDTSPHHGMVPCWLGGWTAGVGGVPAVGVLLDQGDGREC